MKRFIFKEAGPDSDGIWEIRTMNHQCYHSEAKYGTLSRSLSHERRKEIHIWRSWTRFGQDIENQNESLKQNTARCLSRCRERRKGRGAHS